MLFSWPEYARAKFPVFTIGKVADEAMDAI